MGSREAARTRSLHQTSSHDPDHNNEGRDNPGFADDKGESMAMPSLSLSLNGKSRVGVSLRGLTKIYRVSRNEEKIAVDNLSLDFRVGEVTALLGHNGAGKSTTM